jgi:hypothetical protein
MHRGSTRRNRIITILLPEFFRGMVSLQQPRRFCGVRMMQGHLIFGRLFTLGSMSGHYNKQPLEGVRWLRLAAERAAGYPEQVGLLEMASRWASSSDDLGEAIRVVRHMAAGTRDQAFRSYLLKRAGRLEALRELRLSAEKFQQQFDRPPKSLKELLAPGLLESSRWTHLVRDLNLIQEASQWSPDL